MYKLKLHKNLTKEKWAKFQKSQQILMIACELQRAENQIKTNNSEEAHNCYERAFELLDLTICIAKENFRKELLRFREILSQEYIKEKIDGTMNKKLFKVLVSLDKDAHKVWGRF